MNLILQLNTNKNRGEILKKLNSKRETVDKLAEYLWHTPGTVAILLEGRSKSQHFRLFLSDLYWKLANWSQQFVRDFSRFVV